MTIKQARAYRYDPAGPKSQRHWCPIFAPGGLGVRVYDRAPSVFVVRVTRNRKSIIRTLGPVSRYARMSDVHTAAHRLVASLIDERDVTVDSLARDYLRYRETRSKPKPYRTLKQRYEHRIKPALGDKRATSITRHDVIALHAKVAKTAPVEANQIVKFLQTMFNLAIDAQRVPETFVNPASRMGRYMSVTIPRDRRVEDHELPRLLRAINREPSDVHRGLFLLMMHTGMRTGEAKTLAWRQVDLRGATIRLPDPKNGKPHTINLTDEAVTLLRSLRRTFGSPWVFPGKDPDKHLDNPYKAWKRVCKRAKIKGLRMHDLRRSYASWLINHDVSLEVVGQMLNHKSLQTTRKVYAQVSDTAKKDAVKKLAAVVSISAAR